MRSESFDSPKAQELTVDDIDDFEDDDDLDEVGNFRISRRTANDAADLVPRLPSFATGNIFGKCISLRSKFDKGILLLLSFH